MAVDAVRAKSLFLAASDLADPAERAAYLQQECGGDAELRGRVEVLLRANDGAPLAPPEPVDRTSVYAAGERPQTEDYGDPTATIGSVLAGKYKLIEEIGEGGMGSVYMAQQTEPVKRAVAVKVIKAGMDSKAVLARFEAERQALAMMDHPNIAKVLDAGTTEGGRPYFVMELVKGQPITRYCDERKLTSRQRLELFVPVCQAIQHAHQKGVIHRDIKPSNVLVAMYDDRAVPKVIDFGVAKAAGPALTEHSLMTGFGAVVGTPEYMSPEQANLNNLDIDTRSDVYSLGVLLYELLTGTTPVDRRTLGKAAFLEILRIVREVEAPKPSERLSTSDGLPSVAANRGTEPAKLSSLMKGELDWVLLKALEKDRARRYDTANGLARDIQRYLTDEVVEARPPSTGYRLKKFVRRHRGQVIAAGLVIATLLAGIAGTTIGLLRAREQRNLAEERLGQLTVANAKTETERTRAEQNFGTARTLILDLGTRINQIETGQANPRLADLSRKQALDKAREQFDQFREGRPDDITLKKQAALLHRFAANVSRSLTDYPAAMAAYTAAVQISEELIASFPEDRRLSDELALTLGDRSGVERLMGKSKEATATLERALKLAEGPQGNLTDSAYRRTIAMVVMDQNSLAFTLGRFDDAARFAVRGRELWDQVKIAPVSERLTIDPLFAAMAVHKVAMAEQELGNTANSLAGHDDAVARMKLLAGPKATRDERFWDCEVRRECARAALAVPERRAAALADLAAVIPPSEKLIEENPHLYFYKAGLASAYLYRGELLLSLEQPEPATAELTKSLAVSRELLDRHGVLTKSMLIRGSTFLALGRARAAAGKKDDAAAQWKNAAKVFELALKIDPDNFHHRRGLAEAERELLPQTK
jgi:serine/threonine protein kinase/tetratricopeptide (TPR) repeat protein